MSPPRPFLGVLASLLALALLAGCIGANPQDGSDGDAHAQTDDRERHMRYECPPGTTTDRVPEVCVGRLEAADAGYLWPTLAVHPSDPRTFVIAADRSPALPAPGGPPALAPVAGIVLFVTEDGGLTWSEHHPPLPTGPSGLAQPALLSLVTDVHLLEPRTLVVGLEVAYPDTEGLNGQRRDLYVATSPDLGATWNLLSRVNDAGSDISAARVTARGDVIVASFHDRGADTIRTAVLRPSGSWHTLVAWDGPGSPGALAVFNGAVYTVAPAGASPEGLLRIDIATGAVEAIAAVPGLVRQIIVTDAGAFALVGPSYVDISQDHGQTWTRSGDFLAESTLASAPEHDYLWAAAMDADGFLHLVYHTDTDAPVTGLPLVNEGRPEWKTHLVYDTVSDRLVHDARLTPADWLEGRRTVPAPALDWEGANSGGSAGLGRVGGRMAVVWSFDDGIEYTFFATYESPPPLG